MTDDKLRKIHINLSEQVHKKLRIRVAELDTSMQDYVAQVIEESLAKPKRESK